MLQASVHSTVPSIPRNTRLLDNSLLLPLPPRRWSQKSKLRPGLSKPRPRVHRKPRSLNRSSGDLLERKMSPARGIVRTMIGSIWIYRLLVVVERFFFGEVEICIFPSLVDELEGIITGIKNMETRYFCIGLSFYGLSCIYLVLYEEFFVYRGGSC